MVVTDRCGEQVEVWTKPLGGGRTAALFVNTADKNVATAAISAAEVTLKQLASAGAVTTESHKAAKAVLEKPPKGGAIKLGKCDSTLKSQEWARDIGGVTTNLKNQESTGCIEITGVNHLYAQCGM